MSRSKPNWFAFACGVAYLVCFLFLPVFRVIMPGFTYGIVGIAAMFKSPLVLVLLLCGIAMCLSPILLEQRLSMGVGAVSAVLTLIVGCMSNQVVSSGEQLAVWIARQLDIGLDVTIFFHVVMGSGLVLGLLLSIAHAVLL